METVFITPRYKGDGFDRYLGPSLERIPTKCINVADKPDTVSIKSSSHKFNSGVEIAKDRDLLHEDTIVVFAKSNVHILDHLFADKVSMIFEEKPEVGVLGVLGVKQLNSGRDLYEVDNQPLNGIIYAVDVENEKGQHIQYSKNGFFDDIVAVDDSVIAIRGSLFLNHGIRLESDVDRGYGIEIAVKSLMSGYKVVAADILVVSDDNTNLSHDDIDKVVRSLNLTYPVSANNLFDKSNSVMDIDI